MSKTSVAKIEFITNDEHEMAEAVLWRDDYTGKYTLSIDDPFNGFTPFHIEELHKFLGVCLKRIGKKKKPAKRPKVKR